MTKKTGEVSFAIFTKSPSNKLVLLNKDSTCQIVYYHLRVSLASATWFIKTGEFMHHFTSDKKPEFMSYQVLKLFYF